MTELTDDQFHEDLQSEDELGAVIRGHLHIEHALNELLRRQVPAFESLKKLKLEYESKVILAIAMGLNMDHENPLKCIGHIRNKYAHRPGFKLTKSDTINLYETFATEEKNVIQDTYKTTIRYFDKENIPLKEQEPIDQFKLLAVVIRHILMVACNEWESNA